MREEETVPMELGLRGPLVGLRVMDIATVYAAPFAVTIEVVEVARVLLQNPLCLFVGLEAGAVQVAI